ncbi:MAG: tRNA pseudouridine(38-40) synthase TruA [Desulfovibrio sp.]|jgi:tRNA pseudouridine38-40 synthase|nr:tRNA pseudouridine(38-40) synthase TruA [Desulfovibrio sp.]
MRLKLLLAYTGTRYHGWQIQEKPNPPLTVQGELEAALGKIAGRPVRVCGSGRTDAGVHAKGQTAHCDVPVAKEIDWRRSLNALLPRDIRVIRADAVRPDFHARNDAAQKTYHYQFWQERNFCPPELLPFVWPCGPLDVEAMRAALPHLAGRRDFAVFRNAGADGGSTCRTVFSVELTPLPPQEHYPPHRPALCFSVTADGFLKQMVRNMAGLLVACGRKRIDPRLVPKFLDARDRAALPSPTAPACGLTLVSVDYRSGHSFHS